MSKGRTLELVAACHQGDHQAASELFERLLPRVRKIVALRMGWRETDLWEQEDLVQETLLDAYKALQDFEPRSEGALYHWLATLIRNNLVDHARHRQAQRRDGRRVLPPTSSVLSESIYGKDLDTPSLHAQARETENRIEEGLLGLEERQRHVIELRKLCGLSFEEIAEEMGLGAASSARALFSRALGELGRRI